MKFINYWLLAASLKCDDSDIRHLRFDPQDQDGIDVSAHLFISLNAFLFFFFTNYLITVKVFLSTLFFLRVSQEVDGKKAAHNLPGVTAAVEKVQPEQGEEKQRVARQQAKN